MSKNTLTKRQLQQYKEIKDKFSKQVVIGISNEENVRLKEVLLLLCTLGYIEPFDIDGTNAYRKIGNFDDFETWHKDMQKEERKLSRREWIIGLIGAGIGLIPFIVSTVVPWIISLFKK